MHRARNYVASLFLAATLAVPAVIVASPIPQDASVQVKIYDKQHNDYHVWDDNEDHAWHAFLSENHRKDHDFKKANKREQEEYWNWRHAHPDGHS